MDALFDVLESEYATSSEAITDYAKAGPNTSRDSVLQPDSDPTHALREGSGIQEADS